MIDKEGFDDFNEEPIFYEYNALMQQKNDPDQFQIGIGPSNWEQD
jgi:hypothetical protein